MAFTLSCQKIGSCVRTAQGHIVPPRRPRKVFREQLIQELQFRDGPGCFVCGLDYQYVTSLTLHHLVALHENGTNDPRNLVMLCTQCHVQEEKWQANYGYIRTLAYRERWKALDKRTAATKTLARKAGLQRKHLQNLLRNNGRHDDT